MPQQEIFFERETENERVEVLKTYDRSYAREVFSNMNETAQKHLWKALGIEDTYDATELPAHPGPESEDFLWEEMLEAAHEDGSLLSFFVVNERKGNISESLYVSPDWPSAEAFALIRLSSRASGA